jgi:lysophospholipase L1-like esterase
MRLAAVYSNDGLHLTTDGYRKLATLLYEQVFAARLKRQGRMGRSTA